MRQLQHHRSPRLLPVLTGALMAVGVLFLVVSCKARETDGTGSNGTDSLGRNLDLANDTAASSNVGGGNADEPFRPSLNNTAPVNGEGNAADTANAPANAGNAADNEPEPLAEPGPIELTADERLRERIAGLVMNYRWPQGMYPFGLRASLPDSADESNVLWQMIYRAHASHRRGLYEQAEGFLRFAVEQEKSADHYPVLFNLGACRQMMASDEHPEKLDQAIEAFRACLSLRLPPEDESLKLWNRTAFRHFAAAALAQIEMARGNRRVAMDYALESAFTWTPIDYLTGKALPREEAADRLLQTLYAYGDDKLGRESKHNHYLLLTRRRPELSGQKSEDCLADFWSSCVRERTAADDVPSDGSPICYSKKFLQTFIQRWLDDYPDSDRRAGLLQLARSSGLTN